MTASMRRPASSGGISGAHVLAGLIAFFLLVLAANGAMIYTALSTFGGLDNANAYRDGLAYNARISAASAQAERGWQGNVETFTDPPRLRISLLDQSGAPVTGLVLKASVARPATNRYDAPLALRETGPGLFEASLAEVAPGNWILSYEASAGPNGETLYRARKRLWLKP
jgi:nitrogen fixation protein FixH